MKTESHVPKALPILPTPGMPVRFARLRFIAADEGGDGTPGAPPNDGGGDGGSGKEYKAPATQADLDAIIKQRVERERAKFADYNDLKAKARQFDDVQQASKTEAEKANDRITSLERELAETKSTALRSRIQAKHGITDEDAALFLTATDEETLTKQAERLAAREADRKKNGNHVPHEGQTPSSSGNTDERKFVADLFGRARED